MSQAASQASAFFREVARTGLLWTVRDETGFPAPRNASGERAQPFWSSRSRVEKIIKDVPAYAGFTPVEIAWSEFVTRWVPGLTRDGIFAGVNWSGARATGYDVRAERLCQSVEALREQAGR